MSPTNTVQTVIARLEAMANPVNVEGMARYGIRPGHAFGISMVPLRALGKEIGKNHDLAQELWNSGIHEARILATLVDVPGAVTPSQMEAWVRDFDSWDVCDQCCGNLFCRTPFAVDKINEWVSRSEEFVKRAGFSLLAYLAVHDKKAPDETFLALIPLAVAGADDGRNFVKKAVSWSLRQIGKRNSALRLAVLEAASPLLQAPLAQQRWVGKDVTKELLDPKTLARLEKRFPQA